MTQKKINLSLKAANRIRAIRRRQRLGSDSAAVEWCVHTASGDTPEEVVALIEARPKRGRRWPKKRFKRTGGES